MSELLDLHRWLTGTYTTVPRQAVEPTIIDIIPEDDGVLGRIFAPRAVALDDLVVSPPARGLFVSPGGRARLTLDLRPEFSQRGSPEFVHATQSLLTPGCLHIDARLVSRDGAGGFADAQLPWTINASCQGESCATVEILVPTHASAGLHEVGVMSMSVWMKPLDPRVLPAPFVVAVGFRTALTIPPRDPEHAGSTLVPAISSDGRLFAPQGNDSSVIHVVGSDGSTLDDVSLLELSLRDRRLNIATVAVCNTSGTLLLFNDTDDTTVTALNLHDLDAPPLWTTSPGKFIRSGCLSVMSRHGLFVAGSWMDDLITVHRMTDGAVESSQALVAVNALYSAYCEETDELFISVGNEGAVHAYRWNPAASELAFLRVVVEGDMESSWRPLAVVPAQQTLAVSGVPPPVDGGIVGYLVVASRSCRSSRCRLTDLSALC